VEREDNNKADSGKAEEGVGVLSTLTAFIARKGRRAWPLTVVDKIALAPRMVRVRFSGSDLNELAWKRGQDLVLEIPNGESIARRHYTVRDHDAEARTLAIDFVMHGQSPAGDWVTRAKPGDELIGVGPRGHTYVRDADWHLFVGDETAIPGIFAMLEGLAPGTPAHAFIAVPGEADRIAFAAQPGTALEWVSNVSGALFDRVEQFALPPGRGHAYVIGETAIVRAIRQRLLARGLAKDQIAAEGYWRPGRVGGHDHV
jgi:NADPH-dependent ferric siderophore reductase